MINPCFPTRKMV